MVWYSHFLNIFPFCRDPHKGFSIGNETELDFFFLITLLSL